MYIVGPITLFKQLWSLVLNRVLHFPYSRLLQQSAKKKLSTHFFSFSFLEVLFTFEIALQRLLKPTLSLHQLKLRKRKDYFYRKHSEKIKPLCKIFQTEEHSIKYYKQINEYSLLVQIFVSYLQRKRNPNVQFVQVLGKYACVVVQLLPAALQLPALALWRGPLAFALLLCPAGAAHFQCHSGQQLCEKKNMQKIVRNYLKYMPTYIRKN